MKDLLILAPFFDPPENMVKMEMLVNSCSIFGLEFKYYDAEGKFWSPIKEFGNKYLVAFLETIKDQYKYVMRTDGFDSWILKGEKEIIETFESFNRKLVFAANRDHYPIKEISKKYPKSNTSFKYICGGQVMGTPDEIIGIYNNAFEYPDLEDQASFNSMYVNNCFAVDHECKLFLTMANVKLNEIKHKDGKIYVKETKQYPCSIHFGGPKADSPNAVNMRKCYQDWLNSR